MMPEENSGINTSDIIFPETSGPSYGMRLMLKLNRFVPRTVT